MGTLQAHCQLSIILSRKAGGHKDNPEKEAAKITQNICKLDNRNIFGIEKQEKVPMDPCKWLSEGSMGRSEQHGAKQHLLIHSGAERD